MADRQVAAAESASGLKNVWIEKSVLCKRRGLLLTSMHLGALM